MMSKAPVWPLAGGMSMCVNSTTVVSPGTGEVVGTGEPRWKPGPGPTPGPRWFRATGDGAAVAAVVTAWAGVAGPAATGEVAGGAAAGAVELADVQPASRSATTKPAMLLMGYSRSVVTPVELGPTPRWPSERVAQTEQ